MRIFLWVIMVLSPILIFSQSEEPSKYEAKINLDKIKPPSAPSALIIDNVVSAINRPKTWNALETSIYSNYLSNSGGLIIPQNYSLEFSPYWAKNDLKISNEEFLVPSVGQSFLHNMSFSISSSNSFLLRDSVNSNALGFGFRSMLWAGSKSEKNMVINLYNDITKDLSASVKVYRIADTMTCINCDVKAQISQFIEVLDKHRSSIFKVDLKPKIIANLLKEFKQELNNRLSSTAGFSDSVETVFDEIANIDTKIRTVQTLASERKGFKLEIAGALALDFPTNETDFSIIPKSGFWITPSYQPFNADWIEFIGVLRYYKYNLDFYNKYSTNNNTFDNTVDYGARVALKWKKYTVEFEGVGRASKTIISEDKDNNGIVTTKTKQGSDFQYLLNFNYQLKDNMLLTYNFGKQFAQLVNNKGNLVSLLTLSYAFNTPDKGDLEK